MSRAHTRPLVQVLSRLSLQSLVVSALVVVALVVETSLPFSVQNIGVNLLRIPWVQLQLLVMQPAAWVPTFLAAIVIAAAVIAEDAYRRDLQTRNRFTALLVGFSALMLAWFLRFGAVDWNQGPDWQKEWTYYMALKEALGRTTLPWSLRGQFQGTDQFLANPETVFGPQVIGLVWLSVQQFMLAQLLCYCAIGVWSLLRLAEELRLGALASLMFLMLFLLNGHLLSHLAQGHGQWVAYLLLPCVFLLIHRAATGEVSRRNQIKLAFALTAMVAAGGWHVFVWCDIFIAAFVLVRTTAWRFAAGVAVITLGLSAFRILPAVIVFGGGRNDYMGSFNSLSIFLAALIGEPRRSMNGLNWWEFDTFVGWIGFIVFGLGVTLPLTSLRPRPLAYLWVPSAAMIALGFYDIYGLTFFNVPGLASERVASRLVIVGVLGFVLIGCLQLNHWLQARTSPWRRALVGAATLAMAIQLMVRAEAARPALDRGQPPPAIDVLKSEAPDAVYNTSVLGGLSVSLAAAVLSLRTLWSSRQPESSDDLHTC